MNYINLFKASLNQHKKDKWPLMFSELVFEEKTRGTMLSRCVGIHLTLSFDLNGDDLDMLKIIESIPYKRLNSTDPFPEKGTDFQLYFNSPGHKLAFGYHNKRRDISIHKEARYYLTASRSFDLEIYNSSEPGDDSGEIDATMAIITGIISDFPSGKVTLDLGLTPSYDLHGSLPGVQYCDKEAILFLTDNL